jgi:uncharacterized protein
MQTVEDIGRFIAGRRPIVRLLEAVERLALPDGWIGAGLIRNAVWDALHGDDAATIVTRDIDVVYFDPSRTSSEEDLALEARLEADIADIPWEVRNQARMHAGNGDRPYANTADAISHWPETATAIAARCERGRIEVIAPLGVADLLGLIVRPTPAFAGKMEIYRARLASKGWAERWPKLTFIDA